MLQKPRPFTTTFFNLKELTTSILQGFAITAGSLITYQYAVHQDFSEALTRTMVFTVLIAANTGLTLVNRSFYYSLMTTIRYKNNLVPLMIGITILLTGMLLYIHPLSVFFGFTNLNMAQLAACIAIGFSSVVWYELIKWSKRKDRFSKLADIKIIHSLIWLFFNCVIFYMLYSVIKNKLDWRLWACYGLIAAEGLVLLIFNNVCPLTIIARKYSESIKPNFDIYLPQWIAKYNKHIYISIMIIIIMLTVFRLVH